MIPAKVEPKFHVGDMVRIIDTGKQYAFSKVLIEKLGSPKNWQYGLGAGTVYFLGRTGKITAYTHNDPRTVVYAVDCGEHTVIISEAGVENVLMVSEETPAGLLSDPVFQNARWRMD